MTSLLAACGYPEYVDPDTQGAETNQQASDSKFGCRLALHDAVTCTSADAMLSSLDGPPSGVDEDGCPTSDNFVSSCGNTPDLPVEFVDNACCYSYCEDVCVDQF